MKGLYIAFGENFRQKEIHKNTSNGIARKIYYQLEFFKTNRIKMDFINPYENISKTKYKIIRRLPISIYKQWEMCPEKLKQYAFIYIRKPWFMDIDLIQFLKDAKSQNNKLKIILEVPTYPYDDELKGVKNIPLKVKDKLWRKKLRKYVDTIATYSRDKQIFGIQTINIVNAISFKDQKRDTIIKLIQDNIINIMACSRMAYWHGYDRALMGLKKYYESEKNDYKYILHLVGDGEELEKYKKYIEDNGLTDYAKTYGYQSGKSLKNIYNKCIIGFDSLGRHRSKVTYNSSLKSKEYTANGLMVISSVGSELEIDKSFKYFYKVSSNDEPIDYEEISKFIKEKLAKEDIETIQSNIMNYSKNHFDYDVAMAPILYFIKEESDNR